MIAKTEGIVLKSFDFRETSRIATFFTRNYGKVSGVLKGIRKDQKKFGSSVERFSVNDIVYYRYRNSDLHLVSQCDLRQYFFPIRQDLKKTFAASYILELIDILMPVEQKNNEVYDLMIDFLSTAQTDVDTSQLVYIFQVKMLLYSGFRPHLDACVICNKTITSKSRFSLSEGGLVCWDCNYPDKEVHMISQGAIASILYIERSDWRNCIKLKFTLDVKKDLKYLLNNFLVFHLGRKIKSAKFLN